MYVFYIYFFIFGAQKHFSASYGLKKKVFWFIYQIEVISKLEVISTLHPNVRYICSMYNTLYNTYTIVNRYRKPATGFIIFSIRAQTFCYKK